MKWERSIRSGILVISLGMSGFLILRSSPYTAELPWIPDWLGRWTDTHGILRNLPAFAGLYMVCAYCLGQRYRYQGLIGVVYLAAILEFAQILIPGRVFEWKDIFMSWAGALVGFVVVESWRRLFGHNSR
jgi:hypothetical protein